MTKIVAVEGMMCPHCKASVEKALKAVAGVEDAVADLEKKTATVACAVDVADAALMGAVDAIGFKATGVC